MKIVVVAPDLPATSSMAGSPRAFCLLRHIARRHEIHLATFASSVCRYEAFLASEGVSEVFDSISILPNPRTTSFWGRQLHRIVQAPYFVTRYRFPSEFRLIQRQLWELIQYTKPDLLFADSLQAAQYILHFRALPRLVDAIDAISLYFRRSAAYADPWLEKLRLLLESQSIRRFEVATGLGVDAYVVCSQVDRDVLESYHREMKVWCVPNGVDTEYFAPEPRVSEEMAVVFTGVMGYAPNRDAAHFFCSEILPHVRAVVPEVQVQLVGSDPPDDVRALGRNGVTVTGMVPDVRPYVHHAAVYVSPLRFGTGVKNKILAALAMGKAVVATSASCEGLDVTPGEHLLVADNPGDFAAHIIGLFADRSHRHRLGVAGRKLVVERYGWGSMAQQLEALLEGLVSPRERVRPDLEKSLSGGTHGT